MLSLPTETYNYMIMKRILYIVFAAFVLSLVPASYACAQTGSAGKIETPKERKARLEREAAAKKKRDQEAAAKRKREQEAREQAECAARLRSCGNFSEGLAIYKDANGKYGYIDKTGKLVSPCQWKDAYDFLEGLAVVVDANEKWGYINKKGKVVIPCRWKLISNFSEGLATVMDANGEEYIIDKTGKIVE